MGWVWRSARAAWTGRAVLPVVASSMIMLCSGCVDVASRPAASGALSHDAVNATVVTAQASPLHWVRDSSEYRAVALTVYHAAASALTSLPDQCGGAPQSAGSRPWVIVMDADETLLDNSIYQMQLLVAGAQSTPASWNECERSLDEISFLFVEPGE